MKAPRISSQLCLRSELITILSERNQHLLPNLSMRSSYAAISNNVHALCGDEQMQCYTHPEKKNEMVF